MGSKETPILKIDSRSPASKFISEFTSCPPVLQIIGHNLKYLQNICFYNSQTTKCVLKPFKLVDSKDGVCHIPTPEEMSNSAHVTADFSVSLSYFPSDSVIPVRVKQQATTFKYCGELSFIILKRK